MNELTKNVLWLLAGVVIGAAGATLLARQDSPLRGALVGALSQGMAVKDKVVTSMEKAKENVDDLVAEAEARHAQSAQSAPEQAAKPKEAGS